MTGYRSSFQPRDTGWQGTIAGVTRGLGGRGRRSLLCTDRFDDAVGHLVDDGFVVLDLQREDRAVHIVEDLRRGVSEGEERPRMTVRILVLGLCEACGGSDAWSSPDIGGDELDAATERCAARVAAFDAALDTRWAVTYLVAGYGLGLLPRLAEKLGFEAKSFFGERYESSRSSVVTSVGEELALPTKPFEWRVGASVLALTFGDLFEVAADARVSSEQTDFVLSDDAGTISGRLAHRGGERLRRLCRQKAEEAARELAVSVEELPVPTVIETVESRTGRWFHAGIHGPWQEHDAKTPADDLRAIEVAVDEIVHRVSRPVGRLGKVAFPLLGTGRYGIAPELVASTLVRTILVGLAREKNAPETVLLVLPRSALGLSAFEAGVQALLDSRSDEGSFACPTFGLELTRSLESRIRRASDPGYRAWLLCCLAEQLIAYMHAVTVAHHARLGAATVAPSERWQASFGTLRTMLLAAVSRPVDAVDGIEDELSYWADLVARVCTEQAKAMEKLNAVRNDVAHRYAEVNDKDVLELVLRLTGRNRWSELREKVAPPQAALEPWVRGSPAALVLSEVVKGRPRYVEASTGLRTR